MTVQATAIFKSALNIKGTRGKGVDTACDICNCPEIVRGVTLSESLEKPDWYEIGNTGFQAAFSPKT